jgi:AMP-polyphosphate phosphotransferase
MSAAFLAAAADAPHSAFAKLQEFDDSTGIMFRTAELGRSVPKEEYEEQVPLLRAELLEVQRQLCDLPFPVILVFGGVDGAGKSETINLLNGWLDPRWLTNRAYGPASDEMKERPEFWRYWRDLPPNGRIGLFQSSWYSRPVLERVYERTTEAEFDDALERVANFEKYLADDGALIIKFWMHLGRKEQKRRFQQLEKDPLTRWRVTSEDWKHLEMYTTFVAAAERTIMRTSTGTAPWHIIEGSDERYRSLSVGRILFNGIQSHIRDFELHRDVVAAREARSTDDYSAAAPSDVDTANAESQLASTGLIPNSTNLTILSSLDMTLSLDKKSYLNQLEEQQGRLNRLARRAQKKGISTILVFEGWDAAGKGSAIRRVVSALDARALQVIPVAKPTDEESRHHYLWRFWRHLSRAGRVTIFDRSWYGRVLVERVEKFATDAEWKRAYTEINDFEDQLVRHGVVLCKFWMHVTDDEQLARFEARKMTLYKQWKLTDEDWRNRDRWSDYETAVNDMVERTSTSRTPWTLVEANDKRFARIKVLKTVASHLTAKLEEM